MDYPRRMEHAQSPDDGRDDADDSSVGHSEDEDELVPLPCIVPGCGSVVLSNLNTGRVPCTDARYATVTASSAGVSTAGTMGAHK